MQLKRDTEYALRILFCFETELMEKQTGADGLSIGEIGTRSGVPRVGADRVCGYLEEAGLIASSSKGSGETVYQPKTDLRDTSLLDVLRLTEPSSQLFAVFDKSSFFYKIAEPQLQEVQTAAEKIMSELTIGRIAEAEKSKREQA